MPSLKLPVEEYPRPCRSLRIGKPLVPTLQSLELLRLLLRLKLWLQWLQVPLPELLLVSVATLLDPLA
jgi:hypothetical protein